LKVEKHDFKPHVHEILEITPFPVIIGLDLMKKENILMGCHEDKKFLEINGTRTYFSSPTIRYPLEMNEEILEISEDIYKNKLHFNDQALLLTTNEGLEEEEYQELDKSFIKQVAGDTTQEPDLLWIRGQLFNSATKQLKEPVINISSEVDHLSDVILPTVRDSSLDDMIEEAVEQSPLLTQEQREILRSLLKHYEDIFATCLDDVGTANNKPFHIDIKPGSLMIKSKPYDLGMVMNEIVRRELEKYVHAGKLVPGNPICTAPVFLVCIPRNKGSQKIKELKQCFSRNFNLDSTASVTELADAVEQEFSIRMVCDFRKLNEITVKKYYPLPLLRSILQRCHRMKYISNVNFKSGYLHFAIDEESQKYFGILTPWGVFQWLNLCFGPTNGPSDFQEFLEIICAGLPNTSGLIDDVLTMGQKFVETLLVLEALFARLRFYNVKINLGK